MKKVFYIFSVFVVLLFGTASYAKNSIAIKTYTSSCSIKLSVNDHLYLLISTSENIDLELDEDLSDEHFDSNDLNHYLPKSNFINDLSSNISGNNLDKIAFCKFLLISKSFQSQPIYLQNQVFII